MKILNPIEVLENEVKEISLEGRIKRGKKMVDETKRSTIQLTVDKVEKIYTVL